MKWVEFLKWLLPAIEKFPKKVRFTFSDRIITLAVDVVEDLVEARYSTQKMLILKRADLRLEKLRVLLRLTHQLGYLPHAGYEHAAKSVNEVGKMLGGWLRQQGEK